MKSLEVYPSSSLGMGFQVLTPWLCASDTLLVAASRTCEHLCWWWGGLQATPLIVIISILAFIVVPVLNYDRRLIWANSNFSIPADDSLGVAFAPLDSAFRLGILVGPNNTLGDETPDGQQVHSRHLVAPKRERCLFLHASVPAVPSHFASVDPPTPLLVWKGLRRLNAGFGVFPRSPGVEQCGDGVPVV